MPIIVSHNGKNASKLDPISFGLEDKLQQYIYDNPESIPLYDIRDDIQLLILAREFGTNSGPIDAVGIDHEGQLYLVETKLYKNPDKRTVVAQVLDYGASLWRTLNDFDDFLLQLNAHVQKKFGISATEKIQEYFSLSDDELPSVLEQMKINLDEGNFKFVVLMDSIEDRLKDLIVYMNQNSKFDIYGVELEYYQHESFEILIPKLYGAQVKKDVNTKKADSTFIGNDEFISAFSQIGLSKQIGEIIDTLNQMQTNPAETVNWEARRTPKNISFTLKLPQKTKQSLTISCSIHEGKPSKTLDFWLYDKEIEQKTLESVKDILKTNVQPLQSTSQYGVVVKWSVKDFSQDSFITFCKDLSSRISS